MEYQSAEYPNSNCDGKQVQIPGRIVPLLKPVRNSPFSTSGHFKWYLINVGRRGRWPIRSYCKISSRPRQLRSVLYTFMRYRRHRNGHSFFLLTPPSEFMHWQHRFPMFPVVPGKGNRTDVRAKKLKRLEANKEQHDRGEDRPMSRCSDQRKQKKLTKTLLPQPQASAEGFVYGREATPLANPAALSGDPGPLMRSMHRPGDVELTRLLERQNQQKHAPRHPK